MIMNRLNIKKFGFSIGFTGVLCYLGCVIIMQALGLEGTTKFFNSLLHGLDVRNIIRMDVPVLEVLLGIVQTFVIGWLIGVSIVFFYNAQLKNK